MGWLVGYMLASMVGAFFVVRIFDYIFSGVSSGIAHTARAGLFVGTWTAITVSEGMRDLSKRARRLRELDLEVSKLVTFLKRKGA